MKWVGNDRRGWRAESDSGNVRLCVLPTCSGRFRPTVYVEGWECSGVQSQPTAKSARKEAMRMASRLSQDNSTLSLKEEEAYQRFVAASYEDQDPRCGRIFQALTHNEQCSLPLKHKEPCQYGPHDCRDCGTKHGVCKHCGTTHGESHGNNCRHAAV